LRRIGKGGWTKLRIGLDSNILIELVSKAARRRDRTVETYNALAAAGAEFVITDHALLEAFSVLSRSPAPVGVEPRLAERLLKESFDGAIIAPLRPGLAWNTIRHTLAHGFWGGRVYDAVIALATYEAGARVFLTWNTRHFYTIAPAGLEVREP
jgi:predicted nucleic acid-binding protein